MLAPPLYCLSSLHLILIDIVLRGFICLQVVVVPSSRGLPHLEVALVTVPVAVDDPPVLMEQTLLEQPKVDIHVRHQHSQPLRVPVMLIDVSNVQ